MSEVKVLMIGEKPLISSTIAGILSNGKYSTRSGKSGHCKVHEYQGQFMGKKASFRVTSVIGHVFSLDFPPDYQNREKVDPLTLFTAPTSKKEAKPEARIASHLKKEAKGCDYLVLWLDCDREGENICFEVIDCTKKFLKYQSGPQIYRAHFSSLAPVDIRKAMENLGFPNENESLSVDARQEIDLKVGVAFSRFQTKYFQGKYGNLDSHLISYGPCQTPTLGFCVDRHDEIQTFSPENFWYVAPRVDIRTFQIELEWQRKRVFDQNVGELFEQMILSSPEAKLVSCVVKDGSSQRPKPLNTVELLKIASKQLGMGPHTTMHSAERLYTQGYISYPRTETTKYPTNFNLNNVLREHSASPYWGEHARSLLEAKVSVPTGGHDAGDHPPITPMRVAQETELDGNMWRLYEYITRHFLGTVSGSCKYKKTKLTFDIAGEIFTCSGKRIINPGFYDVMPWLRLSETELPDMTGISSCRVVEAKLKIGQTQPPGYLTESELIGLMEQNGIGTDASISTHINNICERSYVKVEGNNRTLVPTPIGIALVHGYHRIDPDLVLPVIRSSIETYVNNVAQGAATVEQVVSHSLQVFQQKYQYFVANINKMQELFEADFSPIEETVGKFRSKCGKCSRYMKFLNFKPSRLFCPQCDEVYPLPQGANIKLYKEIKCPLDQFELVLVCYGKKNTYPVCPYCYNNPPFENVPAGMGCNECLNPSCKFSMVNNVLVSCPECEKGVVVFDLNSKPKWRFNCNKCQFVSFFAEGAHNITLLDKKCTCLATIVKVDFNKNDSPLPGGEIEYEGCVLCDDLLNDLLHAELSKKVHPMFRRGKGRKRGGKRGRGRGRK